MEFSNFFKDIKERLSSPFFSSFIITWLVTNWKIVIGLVLYKITDLRLDGYKSYLDLVSKNNSLNNMVVWPLSGAAFYVVIFPVFRHAMLWLQAHIKRWDTETTLKVSKTGKISVLKFIALREKYQKLIEEFETISEQETNLLNENHRLKNEVRELDIKALQLQTEINQLQYIHTPSLDGNFTLLTSNESVKETINHYVKIFDYLGIFYQGTTEIDRAHITKVITNNKELVVIFKMHNSLGRYDFWMFSEYKRDFHELIGIDSNGCKISLTKTA